MGNCVSSTARLAGGGADGSPPPPPPATPPPPFTAAAGGGSQQQKEAASAAAALSSVPLNDVNNFIHILKASADCIAESLDGLLAATGGAAAAARAAGGDGGAAASAVEAAATQTRLDVQNFLIAVTAHELVTASTTIGARLSTGDLVLAHPAAPTVPASAVLPPALLRVPFTQPGWVDVHAMMSDLLAEASRLAEPVSLRLFLPPGPRLYARFHDAPVLVYLRLMLTRAVRVAQGVLEAAAARKNGTATSSAGAAPSGSVSVSALKLPAVGLAVGLAPQLPAFSSPVPLPPALAESAHAAWQAAASRPQPPGTVWLRFEVLDPFTGTAEAAGTTAGIRHRYAFTVPYLLSIVEGMGGGWGGAPVPVGPPGSAKPPVAVRWLIIPAALAAVAPEVDAGAAGSSNSGNGVVLSGASSRNNSSRRLGSPSGSYCGLEEDGLASFPAAETPLSTSEDAKKPWLWEADTAPASAAEALLGGWEAIQARFLTAPSAAPVPAGAAEAAGAGSSDSSSDSQPSSTPLPASAALAAAPQPSTSTAVAPALPAPAPATAALPAPAPASGAPPPPPLRLHVLLVDDISVVRRFGAACLTSLGCTCVTLTDGDEVPAELEAAPRPFDAMLLDVAMTRTDGAVVCADLRRRLGARCPIIAMTSSATPADAERYRAMGFDVLLQKPFTADAMRRALLLGLEARGLTRLARLPAHQTDGGSSGSGSSRAGGEVPQQPALSSPGGDGFDDTEADSLVILPSSPPGVVN